MIRIIFLICVCLCSFYSFPLKDCQSRSQDILFIIDCRSEVQEQIDFIHTSTNYLSKDSNQFQSIYSYISFSTDGVFETNNLTEIKDSECGQLFPIDDIFNASKI
ncbi:G-protein coupled receptor GRL101, partial [Biomphalaria glabrata]